MQLGWLTNTNFPNQPFFLICGVVGRKTYCLDSHGNRIPITISILAYYYALFYFVCFNVSFLFYYMVLLFLIAITLVLKYYSIGWGDSQTKFFQTNQQNLINLNFLKLAYL